MKTKKKWRHWRGHARLTAINLAIESISEVKVLTGSAKMVKKKVDIKKQSALRLTWLLAPRRQ
ncbi:MAG: hypothetical protein LBG43_07875 [Treponema sp.]|jgi:hypothetical protein|nr:hypothetical protein [Treponema sp.]